MKKQNFFLVVLTFAFALGLTSCTRIIGGIYGFKKLKPLEEETIAKYSRKYHIPLADSYQLDTSYMSYLQSFIDKKYEDQQSNHYQPLQALYYDASGQLQSFHVNCYTGGFPNLKWNRNEMFSTFPPQQQAPLDSLLPLDMQLRFIRPMASTKVFSTADYEAFVVVYWNRFIGRQSKRLIRLVQHNSQLETEQKIKIIYVNNDNFFAAHPEE